jgi:carbon starvation protein
LSLPYLAKANIGPVAGVTTSLATLFIIVCTLASVGIVVVNALSESAWGMFTILVTIPAAMLTGLWMYKIRPGKVAEASIVGVSIVLAGVFLGQPFAASRLAHTLLFEKTTLSVMLPAYALIASVLPVWVLMCPRDYLSSYMKIGVMMVLAVGIFAAHPTLQMPATTRFISGGGPVVSGTVWPFVCIVIMCGAISGFHSLIASGTTPKMLDKESDIKPIGYGAMVVEGFVSVTALVAACALHPGDYFAINVPQDKPAQVVAYQHFVEDLRVNDQWDVAPHELKELEAETQESLAGRTGGAVTLAVGMAKVFARVPGMRTLMSYWYHFVIMFEALFILTLLETGTRVARFVFQETIAQFSPKSVPVMQATDVKDASISHQCPACKYALGAAPDVRHCPECGHAIESTSAVQLRRPNWWMNVSMSVVTCFCWGYLLYTGDIKTLWSMLGIANQLLASIALAVGTTYLLLHAPKRRYAWCTFAPFLFVLATTFTASVMKIQEWWDQIAKVAPAERFSYRLMCALATIMLVLTAAIAVDAARRWIGIVFRPSALLRRAKVAD